MIKKNSIRIFLLLGVIFIAQAQNPAITSFLQNTTETGSYYMAGNSTAINNNILVNCQQVEYSNDFVYVTATGIPAYPTGPFLGGNPSTAQNQNNILKLPLAPQENTSTPDNTVGGNIGVFVNGVALFDFRDGVGWNSDTNSLCGGPGNPPCPGGPMAMTDWSRDAIPAERLGFDCSKGHPAMGNYHHHQNPSAFKLDLEIVSDICNLYDADGLYFIDDNVHSPLIGFAFDGFPIYGAYGFKNADGTGGIERIKSGYQLRDILERTHWADGTNVDDGPDVSTTYYLGYFREDYEFISNSEEEYLDDHNGRYSVTPEYPEGIYAYFSTVDENWNSAYPYVVGPTFYGIFENRVVNSINEDTIIYEEELGISETFFNELNITVFPNPASDLIAVQLGSLVLDKLVVELFDVSGKLIKSTVIKEGSTIAYFDVQTVYEGLYLVKVSNNKKSVLKKVIIKKE